MSKCIGCGITLQNEDVNALGYTKKLDNKYCERCFKTIHYNEERKINNVNNSKVLNKINKLGLFTIFITDLISLNKKLIDVFKNIKNEKVLVINKCDIIPNNLKLEHLEENIKHIFNIKEEVFFISAKKDLYLNRIIDLISENESVIFCGETSSGKSTLINKLLDTNLTTSKYNNTTLDFIKLKYDNFTIYDSPGIIINENKKTLENIKILTKNLSNKYILSIDNLKLKGTGSVTFIVNDKVNITSKKEDVNLDYRENINKSSDIELLNGFIYIKNNANIISNEKLEIRNSIIKN